MRITLKDIYKWKLDDVRFCTEKNASFNGKKRSIDVFGQSDELIIVIENKVNAKEHYNNSNRGQTLDYFEYIESVKKDHQKCLFFFITADQKQSAYADMYVKITYQEMFDNIISKCMEHPQISEDGKYLIEQYAANLRETVKSSNTPMAMVNASLCRDLYNSFSKTLNAIFEEVEREYYYQSSVKPSCIVYDHYKTIFDEIYLSVEEHYGRTPDGKFRRQNINFTEMFNKGVLTENMLFYMEYDGEIYRARPVLTDDARNCYFQVLDENGNSYIDKDSGKIIGIYTNPSEAAIDAINLRRESNGISDKLKTIGGTVLWVNEDGYSLKDLANKI